MSDEKIILLEDVKVEYRTNLEGWTGENNLYYGKGDEGKKRAIEANYTHKKCECGNIFVKNSYCKPCYDKKSKENFLKLEVVEWDGESYMCLRNDDRFFYDMDEFIEWCIDEEIEDPTEVQLMLCEQEVKISEINIDELNEEYCSGDGEEGVCYHHPEISEKVEELNELIRNAKPKIWFQSNKRIIIPSTLASEIRSETD